MSVADLPTINASLNALATVLLLVGYGFIKTGHRQAHKRTMISAFIVSVIFLTCYLIYHLNTQAVTTFQGPVSLKPVYFTILTSHIILAAAVPPMCLMTLYRAWREQFDQHRRIAKITFPIWLYVSVTGVLIYGVLYHLFPVSDGA